MRKGENAMSYYLSKTLETPFEAAVEKVTEALKKEGFGVLTEIDMQGTMKKKLDVNIQKYRILGACNPPLAYQALQAEDKIGLMLPCNVIVQEVAGGGTEVAAIDPVASMQAVNNPKLGKVGAEVREKLRRVIDSL
jgi:uncharacterized protein (DUF302 family)